MRLNDHLEAVVVETHEEHKGARLGVIQGNKVCGKTHFLELIEGGGN